MKPAPPAYTVKERRVLTWKPSPPLPGSTTRLLSYVSHEEVEGKRAEPGEVKSVLAQINCAEVIRIITLINYGCSESLGPDHTRNPRYQTGLKASLFDLEWRKKLDVSRWANTPDDCIIFHRAQMLFLLDLALENCPLAGGLPWDAKARHLFGRASLMVNDLLSNPQEVSPLIKRSNGRWRLPQLTETERWVQRATTLPTLDLDWDQTVRNQLARAYKFWIDLPQNPAFKIRAGKEWVDWEEPFSARYGLTIKEFFTVVFALWMYVIQAKSSDDTCARYLIFDPYHALQHISISKPKIAACLQILSLKTADFQQRAFSAPRFRRGWDLTLLRSHPLIELDNSEYAAFDPSLLYKAATEGIYYLIQESLPDAKVFGNMFGHVYDAHIEEILHQMFPSGSPAALPSYYPCPMFAQVTKNGQPVAKKNDEFSDGLINYGRNLVMIENKGVLLSGRAKYSGEGELLQQALDDKLVDKGGITQIIKKLRRLALGEKPAVPNFDLPKVRRIFPLLVVYDTAPSTPLLNAYLIERWEQALDAMWVELREEYPNFVKPSWRVGKLVVFSTYEIEALESVCKHRALDKVLLQYEQERIYEVSFRLFLQGNFFSLLNNTDVVAAQSFMDFSQSATDLLFNATSSSSSL